MWKLIPSCGLAVVFAGLSSIYGDTLSLKDDVSISGKILAEKTDTYFVDLGFTILTVPKSQVIKISKNIMESATPTTKPELEKTKKNLYYENSKGPSEQSVREWMQVLGESVVQVRTPSGLGSGFFINEEGHLITNYHVIEGETQISVEVYHQKSGALERKSYKNVAIIALNKFADLALLKIDDSKAPPFVPSPLGSSDATSVGERLFAIGSPLGLERTVTEGILSTKTRVMESQLFLQTTAQINPGNSGGPLFNLKGEVVGVTNMKIIGEGLGFAIPVETLKYFLNHRDAFAYDNDNPKNPYRYLAPPRRVSKAGNN